MTEITVTKNDAGQRADRFLTKAYPNLSLPLICKLMRKKRIKLNGARTEPNTKLAEGDVFRFYLSDELLDTGGREKQADFRSVPAELDIIYEDENILLCDKPVGMVVHEDNDNTSDTLINRIKCYLWKKGEYDTDSERSFAPALCNRIDRNTGGIVIAAKDAETLRVINEKIRDRELDKRYLCITAGRPKKPEGRVECFLLKDEKKKQVSVYHKPIPGGKTAITDYKVLETRGELSLVEIGLETGRTHQIRATMADLGCPLLGDGKYGRGDVNRRYGETRQVLYAYKLTFDLPTDAGHLNYLRGRSFTVKNVPFRDKYFG